MFNTSSPYTDIFNNITEPKQPKKSLLVSIQTPKLKCQKNTTNQHFLKYMFAQYGEITNFSMFNNREEEEQLFLSDQINLKFFIEFVSLEQAIKAKQQLDNTSISEHETLKIEFDDQNYSEILFSNVVSKCSQKELNNSRKTQLAQQESTSCSSNDSSNDNSNSSFGFNNNYNQNKEQKSATTVKEQNKKNNKFNDKSKELFDLNDNDINNNYHKIQKNNEDNSFVNQIIENLNLMKIEQQQVNANKSASSLFGNNCQQIQQQPQNKVNLQEQETNQKPNINKFFNFDDNQSQTQVSNSFQQNYFNNENQLNQNMHFMQQNKNTYFSHNCFNNSNSTINQLQQNQQQMSNGEKNNQNVSLNLQNFVNHLNPKMKVKYPVLMLKNLDSHKKLNANLIFQLFSNFGNIVILKFLTVKQEILIQFSNEPQASCAKKFLKDYEIGGCQIKMTYSHQKQIFSPQFKNTEEIYIFGNEKDFRFDGQTDMNKLNPPSATLHVSNLSPQAFDIQTLYNIFSPFGGIENIQLYKKNYRNMSFIKFRSISESFNAMELHTQPICGRKIHISFTRINI